MRGWTKMRSTRPFTGGVAISAMKAWRQSAPVGGVLRRVE